MDNKSPSVQICRRVHFSCGHRYFNPELSENENKKIFGSCYSEFGHGHNYKLDSFFTGPIDPTTGMVANLQEIDEIINVVVCHLDHRHLNFDVPYFKDKVPTTENIAKYCFEEINKTVSNHNYKLLKVRLYETDDLWAEYEC